jgi:agmatine deiminase
MTLLDRMPAGCRMPAEWEPHEATWIAWPHNMDDWPEKFGPIPWVYAEIVRHLHASERVCILVNADVAAESVRAVLERIELDWRRVRFVPIPTDRVWTRDYCPLFVLDPEGELIVTDWQFNGWAKYPNHRYDDAVPAALAERFNWPIYQPRAGDHRVVLEGGSIDVNGQGLLLTTEECLLDPVQERNPGLSREELEAVLADTLGIRKVLWLGRGIAGDDTHGHIDDLARFTGPRTVVTVVTEDPADPNHEPLQENLERLQGMTDLEGQPLEVHTLLMPAEVRFMGQRLPASYANFYIANDRVLVPTFNDANDRRALDTLAGLFPGRQVVGIHSVDLIWGLGALHCLTQQQPAGQTVFPPV